MPEVLIRRLIGAGQVHMKPAEPTNKAADIRTFSALLMG